MKRYLLYIILFIVVEAAISASIYSYRQQRIAEYIGSRTEQTTANLRSMQNTFKQIFTEVYDKVLDKPVVKEYLHEAYADSDMRGSLRNSLYAYMLPVYEAMRSTNLESIHFHFPDSTSFLRMNQPESYGQNLSLHRHLVVSTNEKNEFNEGFEKGLFRTGYRYVFPLNSDTEHLGSVEFLIDIDGFVSSMNTLYGAGYKYIFDRSELRSVHERKPFQINDEYYADSCMSCGINDKASFQSNDINTILTRDFEKEIRKRLTSLTPSSYLAENNGRKYALTFFPVREIKGDYIGTIVSYEEAGIYDKIISYTTMLYILISFIAAAVVAILALLDNARRRSQIISEELEQTVAEKVKELRDKEQFYSQQAKMATMGEMLAAILHQWKQPLSSISLLTDMLIFDCDDNKCSMETKKYLQEIKSQTVFMTQTDRDFRNFLKPSSKPEVFNVCDAVVEVIRLFDFSFARYNVSFQTYWTEEVAERAYISGYPNEFKHVVLNLFNNSRDAISAKRDKMIENHQDVSTFKGLIKTSITLEDGYVAVRISDTGGGIPDEVIGKVFDQYFSTKNENGTGIGLYMTRNLVETSMKGHISVKNIDEGAEFTIECPITDKE